MSTPVSPIPMPSDPAMPAAGAVLVGGTFDPPHRGHVGLACAARDALRPGAWLVFVPAARSPHKTAGPIASDADRVAMLHLATEGVPGAGVWTDEIDRAGSGEPSFWVRTLERARSVLGDEVPVSFVIGADQAASLHRWAEPRRLLDLADPILLLRSPIVSVEALRASLEAPGFWTAAEVARLSAGAADVGTMDVSATEIRRLLSEARNEPAERNKTQHRLRECLAPRVLRWIEDHGLYRA